MGAVAVKNTGKYCGRMRMVKAVKGNGKAFLSVSYESGKKQGIGENFNMRKSTLTKI